MESGTRYCPYLKTLFGAAMGLYDMSPDANPILDQVPEVEGMWVLAGFSGHGFMAVLKQRFW